MIFSKENISGSYFEHLRYASGKSVIAINLAYENEPDLLIDGLLKVLSMEIIPDHKWVFSFWGKIFKNGNGAVLDFISKNEEEFTYVVNTFEKTQKGHISSSFEIGFSCSKEVLQRLFNAISFKFTREFKFSGWLVPKDTANLFLKNPKWSQGYFLFPEEIRFAFSSAEDEECARFFATNEEDISKLFDEIKLKLTTISG